MYKNFELNISKDKIAEVAINGANNPSNALNLEMLPELESILDKIDKDKTIKGIIFYSKKPDFFIAGADIKMLEECKSVEEAINISKSGQQLFDKIERIKQTTIAVVDGACLGGGLEFALACNHIICTKNPKTILGLPEIKIGLIPGSGGTKRLPQKIGLISALEYMLTGKNIRPLKAKKIGLVSAVIEKHDYLNSARKLLMQKNALRNKRSFSKWMLSLLEKNFLLKKIISSKTRKAIYKKSKKNYPAAYDLLKSAMKFNKKNHSATESNCFGRLVFTSQSQALRSIFLESNKIKNQHKAEYLDEHQPNIESLEIFGAGLMGTGIATASIMNSDIKVFMNDNSIESLKKSINFFTEKLNLSFKRKHIDKLTYSKKKYAFQVQESNHKLSGDIILEAIPENIDLKQQFIQETEEKISNTSIIASNTSSIPISKLASYAKKPKNIIGIHYFSPAEKMPLVEIIAHKKTSGATIAKALKLAYEQKKIPIIVKDSPGFYVNRVLGSYMVQAAQLLVSGVSIPDFDAKIKDLGFPIGGFSLLDEVGIDIASNVMEILKNNLGDEYNSALSFNYFLDNKFYGKKSKSGFYQYKKKKKFNKNIYSKLKLNKKRYIPNENDIERCFYAILNTAANCLEEGIIKSAREGDIGAVFGFGFPPHLGGPFRYIDSVGIDNVIEKMNCFYESYGEAFKTSKLLISMQKDRSFFYENYNRKEIARKKEELV